MQRRLPKYPEPLTEDEQRAIYENQTAILEWLRSRGHEVDDGNVNGKVVCGADGGNETDPERAKSVDGGTHSRA